MRLPTYIWLGPPKCGKSVAGIRCVGPHALWMSFDAGATSPAIQTEMNPWRENCEFAEGDADASGAAHVHVEKCGDVRIPLSVDCLSVADPHGEAMAVLDAARTLVAEDRISYIVCDSFSTYADRVYRRLTLDQGIDEGYGRANRALAKYAKRFIDACVEIGCGVILITHEREPQTIEGKFTPGGPLLPGDLVRSVPGMVDSVYRFGYGAKGTTTQRIVSCPKIDTQRNIACRWGALSGERPADDIRDIFAEGVRRCVKYHELQERQR